MMATQFQETAATSAARSKQAGSASQVTTDLNVTLSAAMESKLEMRNVTTLIKKMATAAIIFVN